MDGVTESPNLPNADNQDNRWHNGNMNTKCFVVVAAMAVMLLGATAVAPTEDVFAGKKKHKEYNQATSQANAFGNVNYH